VIGGATEEAAAGVGTGVFTGALSGLFSTTRPRKASGVLLRAFPPCGCKRALALIPLDAGANTTDADPEEDGGLLFPISLSFSRSTNADGRICGINTRPPPLEMLDSGGGTNDEMELLGVLELVLLLLLFIMLGCGGRDFGGLRSLALELSADPVLK
jgi:hypothetical protein